MARLWLACCSCGWSYSSYTPNGNTSCVQDVPFKLTVELEFSCSTFTAATHYVATESHGCPLSEYKVPFNPDFIQRLDLFIDWFPENTQEVTLTKSSSGLGFSFLMCELDPPMRDFGTLVRIKKLFPGQPAQQSGRIQEGDVLLAVNGHSLKKLTYPVRPHLKWHKNRFACVADLYIWTLTFVIFVISDVICYMWFLHLGWWTCLIC